MKNRINILITGSCGQLGKTLMAESINFKNHYNFYFTNKSELDITNNKLLTDFFNKNIINTVINCAAFTDVNEAESNLSLANKVNNIAVGNIAKICNNSNIQLIHISTDYVFDGNTKRPYAENYKTNPINNYGFTKLQGEQKILNYNLKNSVIIRTSWLYSKFKNNFVKKIITKIQKKMNLEVFENQIGSPTNAEDLAKFIFNIIPKINNKKTEIYHFSNDGFCSRYELAQVIYNHFCDNNFIDNILPTKHSDKIRPQFSALNCKKINDDFNYKTEDWKISLNKMLNKHYISTHCEI